MPIVFSTSFVLPAIAHPFEYSGFVFQLIIQKKKTKAKDEYDILANGGRYDKLISQFRHREGAKQCAMGVSFDFEKLVLLINEKSKQTVFRSELAICSIEDPAALHQANTQINLNHSMGNSKLASINSSKQINLKPTRSENALINMGNNSNGVAVYDEVKNRLKLFKQLDSLNKGFNISTHILHEKFTNLDEIEEYCKEHSINSYAYIKESSTLYTSQLFNQYTTHNGMNQVKVFFCQISHSFNQKTSYSF